MAKSTTLGKLKRLASLHDFRLLWIGAFLSFTGSWVQNVAQGWYVYELTHDEAKLAFVNFCWSMPVAVFGLFAGTLADTLHKRTVLIVSQVIFALVALALAFGTWNGRVEYWMLPTSALLLGLVATIEMPTRQSVVSQVVPPEDLAAAVPVNAMTFNVARILGPAVGGILLARFGVPVCYLVNAISFLAVIYAVVQIRTYIGPVAREPQPVKDLIFEGMLFTFRDRRLRALFLLETATAAIGVAYMPQLPALVDQVIRPARFAVAGIEPELVSKQWLGYAYTAVGVGAFAGLLIVTTFAESHRKGLIVQGSMAAMAVSLIWLSVTDHPWVAMALLAVLGLATVAQFNTTNALFQLLSPERLRGRVLSMHIWAINGLSPFGVLAFGALANATRLDRHLHFAQWDIRPSVGGVPLALQVAGVLMAGAALAALLSREGLSNLRPEAVGT